MVFPRFSVTKSDGDLVLPLKPTPTHTLSLSWFDIVPMFATFMDMFFIYKHGEHASELIKHALAKALISYYPLAGRIVKSEEGLAMHVNCTGDGVWFIDATADCSLEDLDGLENPHFVIPKDQLLPYHPNPVGMSILLQVTQFKCGGFMVGLLYDHTMADGIGIAQIMKAIADSARGLERPTVEPVWLREHMPSPPFRKIPKGPMPTAFLEHIIVDISQDYINQVKYEFKEQTCGWCSSLDVAFALLWQCRIRAIGLDPTMVPCIWIPANVRNLLSHVLPEEGGYYGNCIFPIQSGVPGGKVAQASIVEIVNLIKDAKKRMPEEFVKWARGEHDPYGEVTELDRYDTMGFTDWSGLGFSDIDYGFGRPTYFSPVSPPPELVCIVVKPPSPKEGYRMIARLVTKEHIEPFCDQLMNFSSNVKVVGIN